MTYRKMRYIGFSIITLASLILPWITINDKHFFLLSFDKKQLQLFFTTFNMSELWPMLFLLIILFLGIFFVTTLGGRVWCGWACPQTIFRIIYRDLLQTKIFGLYKSIDNRQKPISQGKYIQKIFAFLIFALFAVAAAADLLWYFVPPEDFFVYIKDPSQHNLLFVIWFIFTTLIIAAAVFLKEKFCTYVCPYVRIQSTMLDNDTVQTIYDPIRGGEIYDAHKQKIEGKRDGECTRCDACVKVCPTHIDIRAGMQLECINCLECSDACEKIMARLGLPSLVNWTSPNATQSRGKVKFIRFRTIAYPIVIAITLVVLLSMTTTKKSMILNINRNTELFHISKDRQSVENTYKFKFENIDSKEHIFYFEVLNPDITIKTPAEPFKLKAGEVKIKVVILATDINSSLKVQNGKPLPVIIRAFAVDNKEKIFIEKEAAFIYPNKESIK
ncbi:MAG: cytochrome c oxidase accessory protein CcoG [Campylobacteraceae bacterium]|nr:cytochrome c oxidase accessory protein CcoG [Campylobacteraceae bacterium]